MTHKDGEVEKPGRFNPPHARKDLIWAFGYNEKFYIKSIKSFIIIFHLLQNNV